MPRISVVVLLGVTLVAGACAHLPGRGQSAELDEPVPQHVTLEVENQNFYGATIYALQPGERRRIGWVEGFSEETFAFKWSALDMRIEIALLSAGSYYTQPMDVTAGDELRLVILPTLHARAPGTVF